MITKYIVDHPTDSLADQAEENIFDDEPISSSMYSAADVDMAIDDDILDILENLEKEDQEYKYTQTLDNFIGQPSLDTKKNALDQIFKKFLKLHPSQNVQWVKLNDYLVDKHQTQFMKMGRMKWKEIISLFENLDQIKFFQNITALMIGPVYNQIQRIFNLEGIISYKLMVSHLEEYLEFSESKVEGVITNWPTGIPFRTNSPYSYEECRILLDTMSMWSVESQVIEYFSKFLRDSAARGARDSWNSIRYENRKLVYNSIRNLLMRTYQEFNLRRGYIKSLEKYLDISKLEIHQVIENWPNDIRFRPEMWFKKAEYEKIIHSIGFRKC